LHFSSSGDNPLPSENVMRKWKEHRLHSGSKSGALVTDQGQAIAIMLSERRDEDRRKKKRKRRDDRYSQLTRRKS
jgi:hypothetical protein